MDSLLGFARRFALPFWPWYLAGVLFLALTNYITLQIPLLAKEIVNATGEQKFDASLEQTALLIIILGIITIIIRAFSRIFMFWPGRKLEATSKSYLFTKMMYLSEEFYQKFGMGELISRLANDIGQLRAFFAFGLLQVANLVFLLIFTISKMMTIHPILTVVSLSPIIFMIFFMNKMMGYMMRLSLANQAAIGRLTDRATEMFVNVQVIQANVAEDVFAAKTEKENEDVYETNVKQVLLRTVLFPLMGALMNLSQVLVVFYGGYQVMEGFITIGDILAFNVYIAYLGFPLSAFGIIISLYQRSKAALQRINTIEVEETQKARDSSHPKRNEETLLAINNLSFSYEEGKQAISNLSLSVVTGEHIGIFGPIGCGKTTLFKLITRIIEPDAGHIFVNGKDVIALNPQELRRNIGYAEQVAHLFSANILENLGFGIEEIPASGLKQAAGFAQIAPEIERFENQWATQVGEKGVKLSGGQKQRLALARIFARSPKLMLLDDVLSAVDHSTEAELSAYIKSTKCSLLVASHRVSVLKHCDQVIMLDEGKIIDKGSFDELAARHKVLAEAEDER